MGHLHLKVPGVRTAEGARDPCGRPGDSRPREGGAQPPGGERLLTCAGLAMVSGSAAENTVEKKETP